MPTGARPTILSLFAYDGSDAPTTKLVVVFSEPVDIAKAKGVTINVDGKVLTSTKAVLFNEDWGQRAGEYWQFTMNGTMPHGNNYDGNSTVQIDTACNGAGDGNARRQRP